jgi:membrane-associated phospholipid phosphatase
MKLLITSILLLTPRILAQELQPGAVQPSATQSAGATPQAPQQTFPQNEAQRSTTVGEGTKPGQEVIKPKDLWDSTGYLHPFVRMPKYVLQDQKAIWTSPFHTARKDVKYWAIFGVATAALIATDKSTVHWLPNSSSQVHVSNTASTIGSAYTLVPLTAGFYFLGTAFHDDHFRETGLIGFETLIDVNIVVELLKLAADRARPTEGNGKGQFENSPNGRWSSGFPSGHAINTWALASVIAHQYHPAYVKVIVYGLASTVVVARVGARKHFPGDVVAGSAMGWFIGDYVYGKRHNLELGHKHTAADWVVDHVHLGMDVQ